MHSLRALKAVSSSEACHKNHIVEEAKFFYITHYIQLFNFQTFYLPLSKMGGCLAMGLRHSAPLARQLYSKMQTPSMEPGGKMRVHMSGRAETRLGAD